MYAVIDTEGSGLFRYKDDKGKPVPADAPGQPRLASLAMILADADLNILEEYHKFVRPDGWEMSEEASKVTGLTNDFLAENGVPIAEVLPAYVNAVTSGNIIVAHNAQHDCKQLRAELRRAGMDDLFEKTPNICTMRGLTDVCCIPPDGGRGGYKWPKLSEACVHFGFELLGDHSALNDARACLQLLGKMIELGVCPEPKVHFAKTPPERAA